MFLYVFYLLQNLKKHFKVLRIFPVSSKKRNDDYSIVAVVREDDVKELKAVLYTYKNKFRKLYIR